MYNKYQILIQIAPDPEPGRDLYWPWSWLKLIQILKQIDHDLIQIDRDPDPDIAWSWLIWILLRIGTAHNLVMIFYWPCSWLILIQILIQIDHDPIQIDCDPDPDWVQSRLIRILLRIDTVRNMVRINTDHDRVWYWSRSWSKLIIIWFKFSVILIRIYPDWYCPEPVPDSYSSWSGLIQIWIDTDSDRLIQI